MGNRTPLQKRRIEFLKIVRAYFREHPEEFTTARLPTLPMVTEESKLLKSYLVCQLPERSAKFVGKIKGDNIFLAEVTVGNKKLSLK